MWGAITGDIIGSRFEFLSYKSKQFELFTPRDSVTDDSLMTIAVAKAFSKVEKAASTPFNVSMCFSRKSKRSII